MLAPIPASLLTSTVAVKTPKESDFGGEFNEPATIERVRFDETSDLVRNGYVMSDGAKGLLFIDAACSLGAFEIPVGSLVSIDGQDYCMAGKVSPYCGFGGFVHHWEVEVV